MVFRLSKKQKQVSERWSARFLLFFTLLIFSFLVLGCKSSPENVGTEITTPQEIPEAPVEAPDTAGETPETGSVTTFVLTGENFKFVMDGKENPELRVKIGDKVRIEFSSTDGFHDLVLDDFNAATQKVQTGGSTSVEFVVDKKGTFEYYCSVGEHRKMGMNGNLIVE